MSRTISDKSAPDLQRLSPTRSFADLTGIDPELRAPAVRNSRWCSSNSAPRQLSPPRIDNRSRREPRPLGPDKEDGMLFGNSIWTGHLLLWNHPSRERFRDRDRDVTCPPVETKRLQ